MRNYTIKKIKEENVLNGEFQVTLNGEILPELSGAKSIVIGENDLLPEIDAALIGQKFKRHYAFSINISPDFADEKLRNQTLEVSINNANITLHPNHETNTKVRPKLNLKEENQNAEIETLRKQVAELIQRNQKLETDIKINEISFKAKIEEASRKAKDLIEEKVDQATAKLNAEKDQAIKFSNQNLIQDLALPFNNFVLAIKAGENSDIDQVRNYCIGFTMIANQFEEAFESNGITLIRPTVGDLFNAHQEEAIDFVSDSSLEHETIVQVVRLGMGINGRVIVPAQVKVNKL